MLLLDVCGVKKNKHPRKCYKSRDNVTVRGPAQLKRGVRGTQIDLTLILLLGIKRTNRFA